MPAATAACTVATHSSNVVVPHSMPRPPPPRVSVETGNRWPNGCCCIEMACGAGGRSVPRTGGPGKGIAPGERLMLWLVCPSTGLGLLYHLIGVTNGRLFYRSDAYSFINVGNDVLVHRLL